MTLSKKIFISSITFLAVCLIFLGIYNLSFKKSVPEDSTTNETSNPSSVSNQNKSSSSAIAISDEAILAPFFDAATSTIKYYSKLTGQVYQIDLDGTNKKTLSEKNLPGLSDVFWSPDGTKAITKFAQNGSVKFYYYDYLTNTGVRLKDNLDTVTWQNNGKIFYKYYNPQSHERSLNISNPDGSNWAKITDLKYKSISIAPIPRTGLVSFWNSPDAFSQTNFGSSLVIGGENKPIFAEKFGADYLWNSNGTLVIISHSDQKTGTQTQLSLINSRGGEYKNLNIPTFVSKSAWSKDNRTVYFALPETLPNNVILPNDYQENKFTTNDSFWKIDVTTGSKTKILSADQSGSKIDTTNLFLNDDESILFFINKLDGRLYRINL